jgi:hypothetical protein
MLAGIAPGASFLFSQVRAADHTLNPNHLHRDAITAVMTGQRIGTWSPRQECSAMALADVGHTVVPSTIHPFGED